MYLFAPNIVTLAYHFACRNIFSFKCYDFSIVFKYIFDASIYANYLPIKDLEDSASKTVIANGCKEGKFCK